MARTNEWSFEELYRILDVVSHDEDQCPISSESPLGSTQDDLKRLIRSAVPPLLVYDLQNVAIEPQGAVGDYAFDRLTNDIRKNLLSIAWYIGVVSGGRQIDMRFLQKEDQVRYINAKRLRWHIEAWATGILKFPEMRPVCNVGDESNGNWRLNPLWDLPSLECLAAEGIGIRLGSEATAKNIIAELGPRGRKESTVVKSIDDIGFEYHNLTYTYEDHPALGAKSFRLGNEPYMKRMPVSKLGGEHLLGTEFTSEYSRLSVSIRANSEFEPDLKNDDQILKKKALLGCWQWFRHDLEQFWKPRLFPGWLQVNFKYIVPWRGFSELGPNGALLGEGFTLAKAP